MSCKLFHSISSIKQTGKDIILKCECPESLYKENQHTIGRSSRKDYVFAQDNVHHREGNVTYEVVIEVEELQDRTLFYIVNSEGETRAWQPGGKLTKDVLPKGFYFSYRFHYLIFDESDNFPENKLKKDFYTLDNAIFFTQSVLKLSGVLFRDKQNTLPLPRRIKLIKYRDDAFTHEGDIVLTPSNQPLIYDRKRQHYDVFNRLNVLEFTCEVFLDSSVLTGTYFLSIGDYPHSYPLRDYHAPRVNETNLIKSIYTKLSNQLFIKCTFYFDTFAQRWKLEILRQNFIEYFLERPLNILCGFSRPINYLSRKLQKHVAFIGEYPHTARDNGAALYDYMRGYRPDLKVFYIVERNAKQLDNIEDKSKVIFYGSIKHQIYSFFVKYLIFTHYPENLLPKSRHTIDIYKPKNRYLKCFIQHGVIATTRSVHIYDFNRRYFDLFFVSSQREKMLVNKDLNYPLNKIPITGLARWDKLPRTHSESCNDGNMVLVMPTWRNDLVTTDQKNYYESQFYQTWLSFFQHPKLRSLSDIYRLTFTFVPHIAIAHFHHGFEEMHHVSTAQIDMIQKLLKEAKLLITDFSSVAFDMVYMHKPVIFFPFDKNYVEKLRQGVGYVDYDKELPGDIVLEINALLKKIDSYCKHSFKVPQKYQSRAERFVGQDQNNHSQRIVQEIFDKTDY